MSILSTENIVEMFNVIFHQLINAGTLLYPGIIPKFFFKYDAFKASIAILVN